MMYLKKYLHVIYLETISKMKLSKDILFVSTADWNNPFWTNKQHVAIELEKMGYRILYIDSQGLRKPTVTSRDIKRIISRLLKGIKKPSKVKGKNIWVCSPLVLPYHHNKFVKKINKFVLKIFLGYWKFYTKLKPETLWTYSPITTSLYDLKSYNLKIYHAVDDIKSQPGMPYLEIKERESDLVKTVDYVFTTALKLQEELSKENSNCFYFSNVADYDHFVKARSPTLEIPDDIKIIEKPIIGFIGAISSYKVDFNLIKYVAEKRKGWSFVMIGEVGEGDPLTTIEIFDDLDNVKFLGPKDYKDLPKYIKAFDVAIIPCHINNYTKSMFPMKFFEYLSAGVNVVSTQLPALKDFKDICYLADNKDDFLNYLEIVINGNSEIPLDKRDKVAEEKTYSHRMKAMLDVIKNEK